MKFIPATILCLIVFATNLAAQDKYDFDYAIDSKAFEKERKFYVHVHEDYYLNETDSFGVVYVLDAQASSFYNNAKSIIDYLVWSYQITPLIVVGIHSDSRYKEFIPLGRDLSADDPDNVGEAHKLRTHIANEIFPIIERDFRVNEFKAVIGHSRGGAFLANTIFSDQKDLFHAYIAISPGMHYLNNQILEDAEKMIKAGTDFHKFYFCSYGTVGALETYFKPQVNFLDSLFMAHPNATMDWHKKEFTGKTHWTVVAPSVAEGILKMNRSYQVDQFLIEEFAQNEDKSIQEQVATYQKQQQEKLNYAFPLQASRLRRFGDEFSEREQYHRAIELYDLSLNIDKNDLNTYLRKASAWRELKDFDKAVSVYDKALKMLEFNELQLAEEELAKNKKQVLKKIDNMNKNKD